MAYMRNRNKKRQRNMLLDFFLTCNKIGAFTLGGGYAMIPIMEREFVDKKGWMDKQEFMDIMVVAQTTPGIFAIDMASHIGYKLRGVWGGIVGAVGIALPSILAILLIAIFFQTFKDNPYVGKFFRGVRPAVAHRFALFHHGEDGEALVAQHLDSHRMLCPHRPLRRFTYTYNNSCRSRRMAMGEIKNEELRMKN